jgi:hypothetical protein
MEQSLVPLLVCRAKTLASIGDVQACRACIEQARTHSPDPLQEAQLALVTAETLLITRQWGTCGEILEDAHRGFSAIGARDELVQHGLLKAKLQRATSDFTTAIETASQTLVLARELGLAPGIALAELQVAEVALSIDPDVAASLAPIALASAQRLGLREGIWRAQHITARVAYRATAWQACIDAYTSCVSLLQSQCNDVPVQHLDAYVAHPERAAVFAELASVRSQLVGDIASDAT